MLGDVNAGIYVALEILTIARIDNSTAGLGLARKALWEAVLYGNERKAFGKRLIEHPLYLRSVVEAEARPEATVDTYSRKSLRRRVERNAALQPGLSLCQTANTHC